MHLTAEQEIRRRIAEDGAITFAEFMALALYWPSGGYYTSADDPVGAGGDFYTSPLVHPAFGALLSVQLFQMWRLMDRPSPFTVLEMGSGSGLLCRDIVEYSKRLPEGFAGSLKYVCQDVNPNPGLANGSTSLEDQPEVSRIVGGLGWGCVDQKMVFPKAKTPKFRGCVLSNELLDAFPVHQVTMEQDRLSEVYVVEKQGEFALIHDQPSTPRLAERLEKLGVDLAEGQTAEICLGLTDWAGVVADVLDDGFVFTVDYGREAGDLYSNETRRRGTLTTFYQHTQTDAPLRRVGRQDITAQVDFKSVINEGRSFGLTPAGYSTQRDFLLNLGLARWQRSLTSIGLSQSATDANRAGMVDLARPGALGDFKVLVQSKGLENPRLWGFQPGRQDTELVKLLESLPAPLLTPDHIDLTRGRNLGGEIGLQELWQRFDDPSGDEGLSP